MECRERQSVSVKKDLWCQKRYALGGVQMPGVRLRKQNSLVKTVPSQGCKWQGWYIGPLHQRDPLADLVCESQSGDLVVLFLNFI